MNLFDTVPHLEGERLLLREMDFCDEHALAELAADSAVNRYLPGHLYEQKHADKHETIESMRRECFDAHKSILLAICLRTAPSEMMGIAEIYNYNEKEQKASIGCRLAERYWHRGIATEATNMLKEYLVGQVGLKTITAHVMVGNKASAHTLEKCGFVKQSSGLWEDWGLGDLVEADKYVFESR